MHFSDNLVQFYPNRICVTQPRKVDNLNNLITRLGSDKSLRNLNKKKSSVNLSSNSVRAIRDSVFGMYQLSKPRTIKTSNGKFIYNFRQSFITLTLPSKQLHSDVEIKRCLNHFLTNIRRSFKVDNYVWKAELQKNENIHFHISTDKYIPYNALRYYWLLAIKPLGYVQAYKEKFSCMSINDYARYRNSSVIEVRDAYVRGCRSNWESPNCVDVSSVTTASSVSNYLSKYFAKNDDSTIDEGRIAVFGKVWSRSTSLSGLKYINKFIYNDVKEFISQLVKLDYVKEVSYDYATVYYINFKRISGIHLKFFIKILFCNARRYNYSFPIP